jgi:hypothetical protein
MQQRSRNENVRLEVEEYLETGFLQNPLENNPNYQIPFQISLADDCICAGQVTLATVSEQFLKPPAIFDDRSDESCHRRKNIRRPANKNGCYPERTQALRCDAETESLIRNDTFARSRTPDFTSFAAFGPDDLGSAHYVIQPLVNATQQRRRPVAALSGGVQTF